MKKNEILEDFFSWATKKNRENEEGIRYRMKERFFAWNLEDTNRIDFDLKRCERV